MLHAKLTAIPIASVDVIFSAAYGLVRPSEVCTTIAQIKAICWLATVLERFLRRVRPKILDATKCRDYEGPRRATSRLPKILFSRSRLCKEDAIGPGVLLRRDLLRRKKLGSLATVHGVPEDEAASIATAWSLGRGTEPATYDLQTFRDLFGSDAGMLLYKYARDSGLDNATTDDAVRRVPAQQRPTTAGPHFRTLFDVDPLFMLIEFLFLATVFFALMAFRDYYPEQETSVNAVLTSCQFLAMCAFVIAYILYFNLFLRW
ncbi:hypothetical protein F4678DRAFT_467036 [Xylaria arbuscula]|nr:hypothetical protein F4678DRAFT_467036 [Xylaria arbuscula]